MEENVVTTVQEQLTAEQPDTATTQPDDSTKQEKTFTEEEVNKLVQQKLDEEKAKEQRKSLMSIEERERELALREQAVRKTEMQRQALDTLRDKNIPAILTDFLDYTDDEALTASIGKIETAFKEAVQWGVEKRFRDNGYIPEGSSGIPFPRSDDIDAFTQGIFGRSVKPNKFGNGVGPKE